MNEIQVDREAITGVYRQQNLDAMIGAVERGEWTLQEASMAHVAFMKSDILQTLITRDVMSLEAMLKGQVH